MTTTIPVNRRSPGMTRRPGTYWWNGLVSDAHRLLGHLPEHELGPRAAEAVALLALIAGQDVEPVEGSDRTDARRHGLRYRRRTRRTRGSRSCRRHQTDPAACPGSRWFHQRRLHHRLRCPHRDLSSQPHRGYHTQRRREVPKILSFMFVGCSRHHCQRRTQAHHQHPRTSPAQRPSARTRACLTGRIPPAPPHGRTLHRLVYPQQPQSPLPRSGQERSLAAPPSRGIEPAPTHHDGPEPHRHYLGHRPVPPPSRGLACSHSRRPAPTPRNSAGS